MSAARESSAASGEPPRSPCVGVCVLDSDEVCVGCLRSLDEIGRWAREDEAGQRAILERVAQRRSERSN